MSASMRPTLEGSPLGGTKDVRSTSRLVRDMFEAVAPRYDFLNHFLSAGLDLSWRKYTANALIGPLSKPSCVALDVCCGTGDLAFALARVSRGKVIGTDFCHPMLVRAHSKAHGKMSPGAVALIGADTLSLPFSDASVDVITSGFGFRNLADYALGLAEMHRVLKPQGTLAILEFSRVRWPIFGALFRFYFARVLPRLGSWISGITGPYQYLHESASCFPDQETFAVLLRQAGFSDVRYRNFMGGAAALHVSRKG